MGSEPNSKWICIFLDGIQLISRPESEIPESELFLPKNEYSLLKVAWTESFLLKLYPSVVEKAPIPLFSPSPEAYPKNNELLMLSLDGSSRLAVPGRLNPETAVEFTPVKAEAEPDKISETIRIEKNLLFISNSPWPRIDPNPYFGDPNILLLTVVSNHQRL